MFVAAQACLLQWKHYQSCTWKPFWYCFCNLYAKINLIGKVANKHNRGTSLMYVRESWVLWFVLSACLYLCIFCIVDIEWCSNPLTWLIFSHFCLKKIPLLNPNQTGGGGGIHPPSTFRAIITWIFFSRTPLLRLFFFSRKNKEIHKKFAKQ